MGAGADEELLRELAQPLVVEFSPAEADELFPILSDAHFADPDAYTQPDQRIGPLAFGLAELTALVTPVLLAAMTDVVAYVIGHATARGARATNRAIRRLLRGRAAPEVPADEALTLTPAQWAEIHRIVEQTAARGGVEPDRARLIADAVLGQGQVG